MENNKQEAINKAYEYAANLLIHEKKTSQEVIGLLQKEGIDAKSAKNIVSKVEEQIKFAKKTRVNKDMLYGALWCIGGIVLTLAHVGYIFWGAIVFGAIQFFRGAANS
jgi:hypothetical protein